MPDTAGVDVVVSVLLVAARESGNPNTVPTPALPTAATMSPSIGDAGSLIKPE